MKGKVLTPDELNEVREREEQATMGPWLWWGNTDSHSVELVAPRHRASVVMAFRRWGMRDAQPMFRQPDGNFLIDVSEIACFQVDYRNDFNDIDNPDAQFIEHARTDVPNLLATLDALKEFVYHKEWCALWLEQETCTCGLWNLVPELAGDQMPALGVEKP